MKTRALLLFLVLALSACGGNPSTAASPISPAESEPPSAEASETIAVSTGGEAQHTFGSILWDAYLRGVLPDGSELDWSSTEGAAQNDFALFDVDGDGQEELLLYWSNAAMSGMRLDVFGYQNGKLCTELTAFPTTTFYSNGTAVADWSHNQGLAGIREDFWPYYLYRYDVETNTYQTIGSVDGWDARMSAADANQPVFPTDIDTDNDGMVYFLLPADWDGQYSMAPVDGAEYEAWRNSYLDGASPLRIPTQKLTEDNISALGCAKPDVIIPEPIG